MESQTKAVMILLDSGFNEIETMYAKYRLEEEGYRVFMVAPAAGEKYVGRFGYPCKSDLTMYEVHARHFIGIVCPGGLSVAHLRTEGTVKSLVQEMFHAKKLVATTSNGASIAISAGICQGLPMAGSPSVVDDLRNAGAVLGSQTVSSSGGVVSCSSTSDLPMFMKAVVEALERVSLQTEVVTHA